MFRQAAVARREIARNLASIHLVPDTDMLRNIKLAVKRDLQAQRLRPNVPVPSRRSVLSYLQTMQKETGSWLLALQSLLHSGAWTSSGGSFRLADKLGWNIPEICDATLNQHQRLTYLEIGAGWAGFSASSSHESHGIAALAHRYANQLGKDVELHFTNLTPWHTRSLLPKGVHEHPYVTAAGLALLEQQGVPANSVDMIYSQAAAYFEPDQSAFITSAAKLLRPGGLLIYNHQEVHTDIISNAIQNNNLKLEARQNLGGMNGDVVVLRAQATS